VKLERKKSAAVSIYQSILKPSSIIKIARRTKPLVGTFLKEKNLNTTSNDGKLNIKIDLIFSYST